MASVEFDILVAFELHDVKKVRALTRVHGITWGKGFEWETICFDVTPIFYAQMSLLPQVHRRDRDIYANIARLLERAGRSMPPFENVPNRYLK